MNAVKNILGGKAKNLQILREQGFNVPDFVVISGEYLSAKLDKNKALNEENIMDVMFSVKEIAGFLQGFKKLPKYFAVRSSGADEDGSDNSFAGQFKTRLFVREMHLIPAIKEVWASAYSDQVKKYRAMNGIAEEASFAIVIQAMVEAEISGVAFSANPVTKDPEEQLISAVWGLGEGLVSGELDADNYYVSKDGIKKEISHKSHQYAEDPVNGGVYKAKVHEVKRDFSCLGDDQIMLLSEQIKAIQQHYGVPQDIEFAFKNEELFILQSRPITNLNIDLHKKIVWDNSNIIESYPGVSSPLTFSFILEMYEKVYIQFAELMGVDPQLMKNNIHVYEQMLGHLRGRVYYNLKSWYQALAMLPGYTINASFMETMMGVKESFTLEDRYVSSKGKARYRLIVSVWRMIKSFFGLKKQRIQFLALLEKTIAEHKAMDFEAKSKKELKQLYFDFERLLTQEWKAPLVNDFFAMIFFGVFKKQIEALAPEQADQLTNQLLIGSQDIVSIEPMKQSLGIAKNIYDNPNLRSFFDQAPQQIWDQLKEGAHPEIFKQIEAYLYKYGERCLAELKLETISYNQDPAKFISILQSYIQHPNAFDALERSEENDLRTSAETTLDQLLKGSWWKKTKVNFFMRQARDLVSNRENLRFERTRGFGIVREIFSALGKHLAKDGALSHDRDIFYLTKEEIFEYVDDNSKEVQTIANQRKEEYTAYEAETLPERISTYGNIEEVLAAKVNEGIDIEAGDLSGIACCPGIVEKEVVVIHSPDEIDDLGGRIMVTSSTDPGWVSLFPTASGILVERGSLLSHSAIVARELGIPCIVSINHITHKLKTGDVVRMDGGTGQISLIS